MDITDQILNDNRYKSQIETLDQETLEIMAKDHVKALEYARKGIEQIEPEKVNNLEYLELVANKMQRVAREILEKRSQD